MFPYFYTPVYYKPFSMEILSHMENFAVTKRRPGILRSVLTILYIRFYWAAVIVFTISAIAPASDMVLLVAKITIKLSCFLQ